MIFIKVKNYILLKSLAVENRRIMCTYWYLLSTLYCHYILSIKNENYLEIK